VIKRRASLVAPLVIQGWVFLFILADYPLAAAVFASCGVAWTAVLLAVADDRVHQARADRDTARTRVGDLEAELVEAYTDPVTGLPVRRLAERHLTDAAGVQLTVAVADVDDMHEINNGHDHQFGDDYLAGIAARLDQITADGDVLARIGGDEFVLITTRPSMVVAQELAVATRDPVTVHGTAVPVRVSVGLCRIAGGDAHVGLGCADLAMFTAKRRGTSIEHYDPSRDGVPQPRGVRPAIRPRDRRAGCARWRGS
jgi:diguanylate cyclase (GGDEF)-like protein